MGGRKGGRGKASTLTTPHVPERNHLCASKEKESNTGREREKKKTSRPNTSEATHKNAASRSSSCATMAQPRLPQEEE